MPCTPIKEGQQQARYAESKGYIKLSKLLNVTVDASIGTESILQARQAAVISSDSSNSSGSSNSSSGSSSSSSSRRSRRDQLIGMPLASMTADDDLALFNAMRSIALSQVRTRFELQSQAVGFREQDDTDTARSQDQGAVQYGGVHVKKGDNFCARLLVLAGVNVKKEGSATSISIHTLVTAELLKLIESEFGAGGRLKTNDGDIVGTSFPLEHGANLIWHPPAGGEYDYFFNAAGPGGGTRDALQALPQQVSGYVGASGWRGIIVNCCMAWIWLQGQPRLWGSLSATPSGLSQHFARQAEVLVAVHDGVDELKSIILELEKGIAEAKEEATKAKEEAAKANGQIAIMERRQLDGALANASQGPVNVLLQFLDITLQPTGIKAVQRMDDKLEPMRLERQRFGCGVACDGFTSTSIRPLLCFTICSPSGAELKSVIDTSGHAKTAQFYYEQLKAAIQRVGVDDVVAVFSDNARACVKAGQKLEEDDELRVFFMPCGSHSLDLALEDIGKLPWAVETILLAKSLIHFIRARHFPLDLFRTVLELLRVGDTRFASVLIMLERLVRVFPVLDAMVVDNRYTTWVNAQAAGTRSGAAKIRSLVQQQAGMHSSSWRQRVHQLVGIMTPIRVLLRRMDSSQPVASKVYFGVQRIVQEVEAAIEQLGVPDGDIIMAALQRRTAMFLRPLHGAAALLDPEYRAHLGRDHTLCQTLKEDFFKVVDKLTPATADECKVQLVDYLRDPKYNCIMAMAVRTPPHKWWDVVSTRDNAALSSFAQRITSESASATSCERAWSSTDFIQNKRRNRLKSDTADKLIRVYFNSRLLERAAKGAASKAWEWEGEEGEGEWEEEEPGMSARLLAVNEPALNEMMARDAMRLQVEQAARDAEEAEDADESLGFEHATSRPYGSPENYVAGQPNTVVAAVAEARLADADCVVAQPKPAIADEALVDALVACLAACKCRIVVSCNCYILAIRSKAAPAAMIKNKSHLNTSYIMLESVLHSGKFPGVKVKKEGSATSISIYTLDTAELLKLVESKFGAGGRLKTNDGDIVGTSFPLEHGANLIWHPPAGGEYDNFFNVAGPGGSLSATPSGLSHHFARQAEVLVAVHDGVDELKSIILELEKGIAEAKEEATKAKEEATKANREATKANREAAKANGQIAKANGQIAIMERRQLNVVVVPSPQALLYRLAVNQLIPAVNMDYQLGTSQPRSADFILAVVGILNVVYAWNRGQPGVTLKVLLEVDPERRHRQGKNYSWQIESFKDCIFSLEVLRLVKGLTVEQLQQQANQQWVNDAAKAKGPNKWLEDTHPECFLAGRVLKKDTSNVST
ncbi:hypothetical protein QJQ45_020138 [Haematococcus lacustris]|nr:hypothetical protein QJQ45_020138 [Haematococcus lacustris]